MSPAITSKDPLLSPHHVQALTDHLAVLHQRMADLDRIERCGFECGDLRATVSAVGTQISTMLTELGNIPAGVVPTMREGARPMLPIARPFQPAQPGQKYKPCPDGTYVPIDEPCPQTNQKPLIRE